MRYKDFEEIAQSLEIKRNDIIMLHSDLSNFSGGNWGSKCKIFYNYLIKYFKNQGTILVPAFSYSFCKNGYFDNLNSKSEVGIFDEFFRLQKNILRSDHPIFSFSCYGALKNEFVKNTSNSATGNGSIFEKFFSMRGKILSILNVFETAIICGLELILNSFIETLILFSMSNKFLTVLCI